MRFPPGVRSRRLLPWLALAAAILLAVAAAWWWQGHRQTGSGGTGASAPADPGRSGGRGGPNRNGAGTTAQPVSVGVVDRRDVRVLISAIGTLNARATAVVRAKVSGELQKLHFKEGDEVKAGQLLADIDPRSFQATLGQVQGALQRDQAQLKNALLDLQRYQALLAQDSIASQQVDTQAALVRQLQGTVAADQGQVDAARLQLSYTKVTAPIAGRLGLRQADLGNVVNPSDANGLVTITQVRPIDAVFAIPEAHVNTLALQLAQGTELPVELWDREQKQLLGKGRLNALDNAIDTTTGTVKAKAAFANAEGGLFANQFVNVRLQVNRLEQVLTVPATAVQNNYVYLVQADHTVTQRKIKVGVTDGDRVSVQGELQPGDQVVTDGIDRLREGAPVTVIAAGKVQQVDQAVQDAASQPRSMRNLTPAQREQVAKMSPEERKAFFQKLRAERGNSANGGGGAPAPAPAPGLAPAGQPGATAPAGASAAGTGNAAAGAGGGR
ncbi:efflux RND transporter periplasmic adaptor subunit [Comamonas sp. CMM03]|uniref:efflux RND transporter periplasmic adaptor subunit n=1 Tax=Comamonas sp. CMM03 TaxID=2854781 RepID=UPI001C488131|nr:efflux RND transporter periplasmic adaptor subunit [Comamonas sp. CMM03]MBV7420267.1 efflux RND transporter periplasmic adaptor subunit [Comamonas sp. CMM03]